MALLLAIRRSLAELDLGLKGDLTMSEGMERLMCASPGPAACDQSITRCRVTVRCMRICITAGKPWGLKTGTSSRQTPCPPPGRCWRTPACAR